MRQGFSPVLHHNHRGIRRKRNGPFRNKHPHPCRINLGTKFMGIHPASRHAHKHRSRTSLPGIVNHFADPNLQTSLKHLTAYILQPILKHHRNSALPPIFSLLPCQNNPVITPVSSTSILSAAGFFGSPGMVIIAPVSTTTKPAPADT